MTKLRLISLPLILAWLAFASATLSAQTTTAPSAEPGSIQGTVADLNDDPVAGASVVLQGPQTGDVRTVTTSDNGFFAIPNVTPGIPYHLTVSAGGFARWESPVIILQPGQHETVDVSKLRVEEVQTSVTVTPESSQEIAIEQVRVEEKQRGLGIIPNFFEAYGHNPAPLTPRLKFSLAFRVVRDPFTAVGVGVLAGVGQTKGIAPSYAKGFSASGLSERFAADYANQFTDIMLGGAILPSLLHQDPRYFYQGTGTKKSRFLHAIGSLVIAKGDNGLWQPNYSSLGGDLISAGISNAYYPRSSRGVGLVFENFAISSAVHLGVRLLQEFAFRPTNGTAVH